MRQLIHDGPGKWSLAAGSTGLITGRNIEQAVQQLSNLTADGWVMRNYTDPTQFGIQAGNLQISIELKNGETHTMIFGAPIANENNALAAAVLDGERWAFVFPAIPYQLVLSYLTIPTNGM